MGKKSRSRSSSSSSRRSSSRSSSSSPSRKRKKKKSKALKEKTQKSKSTRRKDKSRSRGRKDKGRSKDRSRSSSGKNKSRSRSRSRSRKKKRGKEINDTASVEPGNDLQLAVVGTEKPKEKRSSGFDQTQASGMTQDDVEEAARRAQARARMAGPPVGNSFNLTDRTGQRICVHYLSGFCTFATGCRNLHPATEDDLHSWKATMFKRPCTYGNACSTRGCLYSHPGQVLGLPPPGGINTGTPFHIPKLGMLGDPSSASNHHPGPGGELVTGGVDGAQGKPKVCVHYLKGHCASTTTCANLHASSDAESYTWRGAFHGKACAYGAGCKSRGCLYGHPEQTFGMTPPGGFSNAMIKQIEKEHAHYFQMQASGHKDFQALSMHTIPKINQHPFQDQQAYPLMDQHAFYSMDQGNPFQFLVAPDGAQQHPMGQGTFDPMMHMSFQASNQPNFPGMNGSMAMSQGKLPPPPPPPFHGQNNAKHGGQIEAVPVTNSQMVPPFGRFIESL